VEHFLQKCPTAHSNTVICKLKKDRNRSNLLQSKKEKNKKDQRTKQEFSAHPCNRPFAVKHMLFCLHTLLEQIARLELKGK